MMNHNSKSKAKGVKGARLPQGTSTSPGRVSHGRQVSPDRQPATVRNRNTIRVGTWNVRTLYQSGKLENVKQEMMRLNVNILGLNETRWLNNGEFVIDEYRLIYAGGEKHERGVGLLLDPDISKSVLGHWCVSDRVLLVKLQGHPFNISIIVVYAPTADSADEVIDTFYDSLDKAKSQCKSNDIVIVLGDLNAKVGQGTEGKAVGPHGIGERNERGDRWVQWCEGENMVITNTWFKEHPRRVYTWKSPGDIVRNQIDFIAINSRFKRAVKQSKTYPGADCGSDHVPVICTLQCKLKKLKRPKVVKILDFKQVSKPDIRQEFTVQVKNRFELLIDEGEENTWETMRNILVETAEENVLTKERKRRNKWMTEEILLMMKDRQKIGNRQCKKYRDLDKQIRQKCNEAKESWLNEQCVEIENQFDKNSNVYQRINEISGKKFGCSNPGCIKGKDGSILFEMKDKMSRWTQYIGELFEDSREAMPSFADEVKGEKILKSEVRWAMSKMKKNKAAGPDGVVTEMFEALEEYGVDRLTEIINKIYDDGTFPDELGRSIFITLPKKPGAVDCEQYRTISLICHITKIILRILLLRARSSITPMVGREQFGFVKDAGTRNAIFVVRNIMERAVKMQKDVYMCFIDYSKAFDKVRHSELFEELKNLDIYRKDLRLLQSLYWNQFACIRVEGECSEYINIRRGVRQGCVMSPDLFNMYSEIILRELEDENGIQVGGH